MKDEVIPVTMHLPKSVVEKFKARALELLPDEKEEAASLLLTLFINYMADRESWCLFLPDLSLADRQKWQELANSVYDGLYEAVKYHGAGAYPGDMGDLVQAIIQQRRMTADDLVRFVVIAAKHGNVTWEKSAIAKDSTAQSR